MSWSAYCKINKQAAETLDRSVCGRFSHFTSYSAFRQRDVSDVKLLAKVGRSDAFWGHAHLAGRKQTCEPCTRSLLQRGRSETLDSLTAQSWGASPSQQTAPLCPDGWEQAFCLCQVVVFYPYELICFAYSVLSKEGSIGWSYVVFIRRPWMMCVCSHLTLNPPWLLFVSAAQQAVSGAGLLCLWLCHCALPLSWRI